MWENKRQRVFMSTRNLGRKKPQAFIIKEMSLSFYSVKQERKIRHIYDSPEINLPVV